MSSAYPKLDELHLTQSHPEDHCETLDFAINSDLDYYFHFNNFRMASRSSAREIDSGERVEAIVTFSKGFICSGGSGILHIFERTDKYIYKKSRSVSVWVDPNSTLMAQSAAGTDVPVENNDIVNIALSPSEENLISTTRTKQLYNLMLSAVDLQGKVRIVP